MSASSSRRRALDGAPRKTVEEKQASKGPAQTLSIRQYNEQRRASVKAAIRSAEAQYAAMSPELKAQVDLRVQQRRLELAKEGGLAL